jgi:eukaryotic-like serine/threonine-protein kinase
MTLASGTKLGPYDILSQLGAGGMGEVYRGRDSKLKREVAIKVLPEAFVLDAERVARFQREAQVLASLNHPNIGAIYGLEETNGALALVMGLVEGPTLADRIATGPIPLDEALPIARQIAEGLEAVHERGIIHRDLKPANVKVTPDGTVKVLDFGLAKVFESDPEASDLSHSPTLIKGTQAGMILGTAAYMSPEQAKGKAVDKRSDVWAFGCVLFEMMSGRQTFSGETLTDILASVVRDEPDWNTLPAATPDAVRGLLSRCLTKDPRRRLRDVGEARFVLENPVAVGPAVERAPPRQQTLLGRWWMVAAAALALIAGAALGRYMLAPATPPARTFEFDVTVPGSVIEYGSFAFSPDGSRLALVIRDESGETKLAVRDMSATQVHVLPGTGGAAYPFWSPDGRELGFFSENQLSRIALDGGSARPVVLVTDPRGGAWGAGDMILIGSGSGPILRVPASGGKPPEAVTEIEKGVETSHLWPAFLPDGKRFVFLADSQTDEGHHIRLGSAEGGPTTILKKLVRSQPIVDPGGHLLLGERGQLLAYPFDLVHGVLGEESTLVAAPIFTIGNGHHLPACAGVRGMVAFQIGSAENNLVVLDQGGRVTRTVGPPDRYGNIAVSPDGKRVAFEIFTDTPEKLIWVEDLERGVRTPVSQREKMADSPAWSADSETVYFDSNATGRWQAYRKAVTGGGPPENLGTPGDATDVSVIDLSPDGHWLLANGLNDENRYDLYLRSLDAAGTWTAWTSSPAREDSGGFSPDSRWIVYTSDDSGRSEVYVAPVEGGPAAHRWLISSAGGFEPRFSADGKTIYYRSASFDWTAVEVRFNPGRVDAGTPKKLFSMPAIDLPYLRNLMALLPGGSGFMTIHPPSTKPTSIRVRTGK